MPQEVSPFVIYYNKEMFEAANVPLPTDDWTIDEFYAAAEALTDPAEKVYGYRHPGAWADQVLGWLSRAGVDFDISGKEVKGLDTPEALNALTFLYDLVVKDELSPNPAALTAMGKGADAMFRNQKVAMESAGLWMLPTYKENPLPFEWDVVRMPMDKNQNTKAGILNWGISKSTKNPEAAWDLLKFLCGPEGNRIVAESNMALPGSTDKEALQIVLDSKFPSNVKAFVDSVPDCDLKKLTQHLYEIPYDLSLITLVDDAAPPIVSAEFSSIIIPFYDFGMHLCKTLIEQCEQHSTVFSPFIADYKLENTITLDIPASKRLPQIIVVGSINTDISLNIPHLPNPNETIVTSRHSISPGGKGTNQAVGVAKLNHKVTLLGNVGNDLDVGLIYSCLEEHGIDSSGIHRDRSVNTGKAYIQIQDDGESIITLLTGANATLTAQTLRNNRHFFENCAYCLLQTEIAIEAVEEAVLIAKENNVKTILKPAAVSSLSENILKHTDILIPNQSEMALLCNRPASIDTAELSHQADIMLQKGVGAVVITLGEFGCFLKTASMEQRFPAAADFIPMDSTGGSDAFISAFASYLLYGYDLCTAIKIATFAAGFCISRQGVVPALIDQTSLEKYINNVSPDLLK